MRRLLPRPSDVVDLEEAYAIHEGAVDVGDRQHVRVNFVASVDGAASLDGVSGGLSSPADKEIFRTLRGLADVILVGAGTARREGYRPARIPPEQQARRRARGQAPVPPIALVSGSLDLDLTTEFFLAAEARPVVITHTAAPVERREAVARVADVVVAGERSVDVAAALDALAGRGLRRVLCEGGPMLLGAVAAVGRLDELCLSLSPVFAGAGAGAGRIVAGAALDAPVPMRLAQVLEADGMLFLRYSPEPSTSVRPSTPGSP